MKSQVKEINKFNKSNDLQERQIWSVHESTAKTRHGKIDFMTIYIELTNHQDNYLDQQWRSKTPTALNYCKTCLTLTRKEINH